MNFIDKVKSIGGDAYDGFKGAFIDDGKIDWGKIAGVGGGIAGAMGLFDSDPEPVGYQGKVPEYDATRQQVPYDYANEERRPGSLGRRYFSDTMYTAPENTPQAEQIAGQQAQELFDNRQQAPTTQRLANPTQRYEPPVQEGFTFDDFLADLAGEATRRQQDGPPGPAAPPDTGTGEGPGGDSQLPSGGGGGTWQEQLDAIHGASMANYTPGDMQQMRINDLHRAFQQNIGDRDLNELDDRALRLAARSIFLATQPQPSRSDFSQEELEMMGRASGDANAFTSHPAAQRTWESKMATGTLPLRNVGYDRGVPNWQDMPRSELIEMLRSFRGSSDKQYQQGGIVTLQGGGYMQGPTDGMADEVPATIDGVQDARMAHGEFVIPADVVSHLGNGNSEAGAQHLYNMMDQIRAARTGNPEQGRQIDPNEFVPA